MPLTLTLTDGVIPAESIPTAIQRLTQAFLDRHGLTENRVMKPNVTANVQVVAQGHSFSGGEAFRGAWIEWKVPSFAMASREVQKGFGQDAVDIIHELSGGRQPKDNIYFNVVHTVDGAWNLNGEAMSNQALQHALAQG